MKKLLALGLMGLMGLMGARAQVTYALQTPILGGGTNRVLAGSTNVYSASTNLINCSRQSVIAITVGGAEAAAAGSPNPEVNRFYFEGTNDKISFFPVGGIDLTMNGTTAVTNGASLNVGGWGYLRLRVGCTNTVAGTNLFCQGASKTGL